MTHPTASGWWRAVAAVLAVVLAMAGAGGAARAFAPVEVLPGVHVPICHAGPRDAPADPGVPSHDCCDACALLAPAVLPSAPRPARVAVLAVTVEHGYVAVQPLPSKRQRGPRQSQGPPGAQAHA